MLYHVIQIESMHIEIGKRWLAKYGVGRYAIISWAQGSASRLANNHDVLNFEYLYY